MKVRLSEQGLTAIPRYGGGGVPSYQDDPTGSYISYKDPIRRSTKEGNLPAQETRSVWWGATRQVPDALQLKDLGRAFCGT